MVPDRIRRTDCKVETIPLSTARSLVENLHYAKGGANTATFRHGLIWQNSIVGVAWWIPPTRAAAHANYPDNWKAVLMLSRLVLEPWVPANGPTLLLGASVRLIKKDPRWEYLLTYADDWRGHTGHIYRAAGWDYLGKTAPEAVYVSAEGVMMGRKRGPRTYTHSEMLAMGFEFKGRFAKSRFGKSLVRRKAVREFDL